MRTRRPSACNSAFRRTTLAAALACAFISPAAYAVADPNLVVVNTSDDGLLGSLRYAINYANTNCATVTNPQITFAIPGTGPFVISPSTVLPQLYCGTSVSGYNPAIDGSSQTGWTANGSAAGFDSNLMILLDGSLNYGGGCAVSYSGNGYGGSLTLKGLEVRNWNYGGQWGVCGKVNMLGNRIVNNGYGVDAHDGATIGGPGVADRNVIADHASGFGIQFDGATAIVNNLVGTRDGATAAPNFVGLSWCDCTAVAGTIADNVIVASDTGIVLYDDVGLTIRGNRIGTDAAGNAILVSGNTGISINSSTGATIRDNLIAGQVIGIDTYSGLNLIIKNNRIGTNAAGAAALGNGTGIRDSSNGTRIEGNVVSGNSDKGIDINNAANTTVVANLVGTDAGGIARIANNWGIYVDGSTSTNVTIDNNTISGNDEGLHIAGLSFSAVTNNRFGTQASGAGSIPNDRPIKADCGTNLTFNGNRIANNYSEGLALRAIQNSVFNGNFVSNNGAGILLSYTNCSGGAAVLAPKAAKAVSFLVFGNNESDDNQFQNNTVTGNQGHGLFIQGGSGNQVFQSGFSTNRLDGILVDSHYDSYGALLKAAIGNSIVETPSFGNGGKNINLAFPGGPLPNDAGDADTNKPNNWQNRPVISAVTRDTLANTTTFSFSLDSKAGDYRIDFFANSAPGAPAGQTYLGNKSVTLPADGNMSDSFSIGSVAYDYISAVATRVGPVVPLVPTIMDSSEFADIMAATTLPVPGVSVMPSSIDFGDVVVGRSSGSSGVNITSTGTGPYIISALRDSSCTGPAICSTGSFVCSTTCSEATPYAPGNSCTITASFSPTALGSQTKTLALCDNATGSPRSITFTGNGVAPPTVDISMAPAFWSFGEVLVGLQSAPRTFTTTNAGASQVYLGPVTVSAGFAISGNTCGSTLAAGASCSTDVVFVPTANGGVNGTVQVTGGNTPLPPAALRALSKVTPATTTALSRVSGSGVQHGDLRLPASIGFGSLLLHSAAAQQTVQLTNTGNGTLALGTISVAGPFTLTNGCGSSLAVGASCNVTVGFNPASLGTFNGTLTIVSDAPGGSRAIPLTAQVIADAKPVVRVNTTVLGFGERVIGSQSPSSRVIVTNEGAQAAILGAFSFTQPESAAKQEFTIAGTTCGPNLAPQESCVADIAFKPLGFGPRNGQLQVPSNSADSPRTVTLGGTGCRPFAAAGNRSGRDPCAP